jgi:dienelactone hydrolase
MRVAACLLTVLLAGAGATQAQSASTARAARATPPLATRILVREASGEDAPLALHWFLPPGPGPFPVVVVAHGRDPSPAGRAALRLGVSPAQVLFWLARGIAVVSPVRPGYGARGGRDVEDPGVRFDAAGQCVDQADFGRAADVAVRALDTTLAWLHGQPWADADDVLLQGQSVGGFAVIDAAAHEHPGVVGIINFAGGAGGNPARSPGASCDPAQVTALYAGYGRAARVPSLWVYASNDQYWGTDAPRAWFEAFARGGSDATFVQAPAVPDGDGHQLAAHAATLWAPAVDAFLARLGPPWNAATAPRPVLRLDADAPSSPP